MEIPVPFRLAVERSPDGIVICQNSRVCFVNEAAARLAGSRDPQSLLGRPALDLFDSPARNVLQDRVVPSSTNAELPPIDAMLRRDDDTALMVRVSSATLPAADGAADLVLLVLHDVTTRARAAAALREREERLSLALTGTQEGVWDWNLETDGVVYSRRWKEMLGYADDEIEPHVRAWEQLLHPEDRSRANEVRDSVDRGEPSYQGEFRLRHKDGHYVHVLSRGFPVRRHPGGPVVRIVGTHFDLTERRLAEATLRESEERLTMAFAGAQEGVWDWNLETNAVVYSPRWKQMLGYADHEIEPHVSAWERLVHPDDRTLADAAHESVARGEPTYQAEFRLRHKDGHYVHVLSRGFPVRDQSTGQVIRIVGTHFDLTERKRIEAERARTELLTRMVFAQEDERRRIAREMHDQFGEHLTTLGRRITALRQATAGQPEMAAQIAALEAVAAQIDQDVDHLVWELRPTALDDLGLRAALANYVKDWAARVNIAADLHTTGLLDDRLASEIETALYRIAQEALTNVARHSRATRVEIILERRGDQVQLVVEDDGVGFEPVASPGGRQGFGLLGMQERAALVGAALEIESGIGKGTTILVRMTAAPSARDLNYA